MDEESPLFRQVVKQTKHQVGIEEDPEDDRARIIKWIKDMQHCQAHHPHLDEDRDEVC